MKRIGIDCRFAGTRSGLGRYTREIVRHLLKRRDPVGYVLFVRSDEEEWLAALRTIGNWQLAIGNFPHYSITEQVFFPAVIKRSKIDLLFSPHFNVPLLCPVPFIVTIHDLILHRYPNQASFFKYLAYRAVMGYAIRNARRIIAVSDFTAGEIVSVYGSHLREKIAAVREGIAPHFFPRDSIEQKTIREKYLLESPFFLYVGNAKEHKNMQVLIDAFASLDDSSTELILVTHGKEVERLTHGDGVRIIPTVSDSDLPALYSAARAFVTASLYEGFCLPVAEAEACGCPVIATRRGSIPEVAGSDALLIEPTIEAFTRAMEHPPVAHTSVHHWSWEEAAEKTAMILREAIDN